VPQVCTLVSTFPLIHGLYFKLRKYQKLKRKHSYLGTDANSSSA
jgi:hypothetical protein